MQSLTFSPVENVEIECPPEDSYVLMLAEVGEFHDKPNFNDPNVSNTQTRITFEVADFDYDPDEDDRDWNGARVSDFFVFFKTRTTDNTRWETWKNESSNAYALVKALLGHTPEDGEAVDLQSLVGTKIKATVTPKQSGWPKITKPLPYKKRRKKAQPEPDPIEDDTFDEDE